MRKLKYVYVLAAGLTLFGAVAYRIAPFEPDDAFISYRYAENLASGKGLNFNPGTHPVEGYSNFLWIVYCAALSKLGFNVPLSAEITSALFGALCLLVLFVIFVRENLSISSVFLGIALLAISGPFILYAVSGMETSLYAFLLLLSLLGFQSTIHYKTRLHFFGASLVCFLVSLTRPEGILAYGILTGGLWLLLKKQMQWKEFLKMLTPGLVLFTVLLIAYQFWRIQYFEQILPTPFVSKGGSTILRSLRDNLWDLFYKQNHYFSPLGYYYASLYFCSIILFIYNYRNQARNDLAFLSILLALTYLPVYLCFRDWMPAMRYFVPLIGPLVAGFSVSADHLKRVLPKSPYLQTIAGILILFSLYGVASINNDAQRYQRSQVQCAMALGKWMKEFIPANSILAVADVGAMPYYSGLQTIDIHRRSLTDVHIAKQGFSNEYFFSKKPDIVAIVSFSVQTPKFHDIYLNLYRTPDFQKTYRLAGISLSDASPERCYWVFVKSEIPLTENAVRNFPRGWHS